MASAGIPDAWENIRGLGFTDVPRTARKHQKKGARLRQQGKVAELALGYGGAFGAIKKMDKDGSIPDEEIPMLVAKWRKASPNICKFWREAEAAAKMAIQDRRTVKLRNGIAFSYINRILFIKLLSGRKLAYYDAKLEHTDKGESITYAGIEQQSKRWGRLETWVGNWWKTLYRLLHGTVWQSR